MVSISCLIKGVEEPGQLNVVERFSNEVIETSKVYFVM